eukprot:2707093-Pyramimonas_sp.AAC.1
MAPSGWPVVGPPRLRLLAAPATSTPSSGIAFWIALGRMHPRLSPVRRRAGGWKKLGTMRLGDWGVDDASRRNVVGQSQRS